MKRIYAIGILCVLAVLLSLAVLSQQLPSIQKIKHSEQISANIALEKEDTCVTEFWEETKDIFGNCVYYYNYTLCSNSSGPNTGCAPQQNQVEYPCVTGAEISLRNKTICKPDNKFLISINNGTATLQRRIDHSDWGPCEHKEEDGCLIVTCVSFNDGAYKGQFVGCRSGMSCERFEICENSTKTYYRNSNDNFMEEDPSFFLPKLEVSEVGK